MSFVFLLASFYAGQVVSSVRPVVDIESNADIESNMASHSPQWPRIRRNAFVQIEDGVHINQTSAPPDEDPPKLPAELESKVQFERRFGEPGSFGVAYKYKVKCAKDMESPYIAVKELMKDQPAAFEQEKEALRHMKGKSDYVVSLVGSPATYDHGCSGHACIVMEFFNKGELFDMMVEERLSPSEKAIYSWQLVKGLQAMHREGVVHMDIKLENALVNCNDKGTFCYAAHIDLGLADTGNPKKCPSAKGTPPYIAPEVFKSLQTRCIPANDVWSMGVVIHDLFVGPPSFSPAENERPPFAAMKSKMKRFSASTDPVIKSYVEKEENAEVSAKVLEILSEALNPDHQQRISADGLLSLTAELVKLIAPEEYDRVVRQTPLKYGAKKRAPQCLDFGGEAAATAGKGGQGAPPSTAGGEGKEAAEEGKEAVEMPSAKQRHWVEAGLKLLGIKLD